MHQIDYGSRRTVKCYDAVPKPLSPRQFVLSCPHTCDDLSIKHLSCSVGKKRQRGGSTRNNAKKRTFPSFHCCSNSS